MEKEKEHLDILKYKIALRFGLIMIAAGVAMGGLTEIGYIYNWIITGLSDI